MILFPNGAILITEDPLVKLAATKLGVNMADLQPRPPYDHVVYTQSHPGGVTAIAYDYGHADPKDNGYTMLILDKSRMDMETARQCLQEFYEGGSMPDMPWEIFEPAEVANN